MADGGTPTHHRVGAEAELGIDGLSDVSIVGSGGSSTVYRACQAALDRTVAVKVVHAAWNIETRERFEHEREVMGRLSGHTTIVPIFETGMTNRGEPYLVMPFYPRGSLYRLMTDRGPLPWREAAFLLETLAQTVADCHREGIVHRDVKPGNVLLTRHLQPRLSDFGITLPVGEPTSAATVAYTPSYSPPEAFGPGVAAPAVDVYGLGATFWALLAGRAPHTEPDETIDPDRIVERARSTPIGPPRPDTPEPLVALLRQAMDGEPDRRPVDAAVFTAELRRAVRSSEAADDGSAGPGRPLLAAAARGRRRPGPVGPRSGPRVTAVLVALVAAGLALVIWAVLALVA
jgi:serine/threonine protein kinase